MTDSSTSQSRIRVRPGEGGPPTVDGHPSWVSQSNRQYCWLIAMLVLSQVFLASTGRALIFAGSSAWWASLLGCGLGLLVWQPVWGLMKMYPGKALPEIFSVVFGRVLGKACTLLYVLLLAYDAYLVLLVSTELFNFYIVGNHALRFEEAYGLLAICAMLSLCGFEGISRAGWLFRKGILFLLLFSMVLMMQNAHVENIFPILGHGLKPTLGQAWEIGGACSGLVALGFIPKLTGSATPLKWRAGGVTLLVGGGCAVLMMIVTNTTLSPMELVSELSWVRRILLPPDYLKYGHGFRVGAIMVLSVILFFSIATAMGFSCVGIQQLIGAKEVRSYVWALAGFLLIAMTISIHPYRQWLLSLMAYRFPVVLLPAWLALLVAWVKRRRAKPGQVEGSA